MDIKLLKEKMAKYNRPENCEMIIGYRESIHRCGSHWTPITNDRMSKLRTSRKSVQQWAPVLLIRWTCYVRIKVKLIWTSHKQYATLLTQEP